jgi:tRNA A37 N6-isopentenylltransferase MiaA
LLERDRIQLRLRIAENVDAMFDEGVIEEVRRAGKIGPGASRAIGFREIQDLLAEKIRHHECREAILTATRRYAKRQLTWCRHQFHFPTIHLSATTSQSESLETALRLVDARPSPSYRVPNEP